MPPASAFKATSDVSPISQRSVDDTRPLKVIFLGAGISGIVAGIRFPQYVKNLDLTIYDKNPELGGTWWENRYPGCACGKFRGGGTILSESNFF
jgi:ribulose 1,5-bisphosphate synthetase/thiazole synthase